MPPPAPLYVAQKGASMHIKDQQGRIYEVDAEEAQHLVEAGDAEIIAEPPISRGATTTSKKAEQAEKRDS
jgi:hypothetical protein